MIWEIATLFFRGRNFTRGHFFSLLGVILGVASLVVSMAVISGFQETLKEAISNFSGHVQILKLSGIEGDTSTLVTKIKNLSSHVETVSPMLLVEGLAVKESGSVQGVYLQGQGGFFATQKKIFSERMVEGQLDDLTGSNVIVGKELAKNLGLHVGQKISIVLPDFSTTQFKRVRMDFTVQGVSDFGKYEFDSRMILVSLAELQIQSHLKNRLSGFLLRLDDADHAFEVANLLEREFGLGYRVRTWHDLNDSLFHAIQIEKPSIFAIVFLIVFMAIFNMAGSLYIMSLQKGPALAIVQSLGATKKQIRFVFLIQAAAFAIVGSALGTIGGLVVGSLLTFAENHFHFLPGEVYKLNSIELHYQVKDLCMIFFLSVGLSMLMALLPARNFLRAPIAEGLRRE